MLSAEGSDGRCCERYLCSVRRQAEAWVESVNVIVIGYSNSHAAWSITQTSLGARLSFKAQNSLAASLYSTTIRPFCFARPHWQFGAVRVPRQRRDECTGISVETQLGAWGLMVHPRKGEGVTAKRFWFEVRNITGVGRYGAI